MENYQEARVKPMRDWICASESDGTGSATKMLLMAKVPSLKRKS
jgi:hypothetical protein